MKYILIIALVLSCVIGYAINIAFSHVNTAIATAMQTPQ